MMPRAMASSSDIPGKAPQGTHTSTSGVVRRLPALTGLRIFAALAVFASHVGPPHGASNELKAFFESGYMGVTLFFTLSGFVLAINYFERQRCERYL